MPHHVNYALPVKSFLSNRFEDNLRNMKAVQSGTRKLATCHSRFADTHLLPRTLTIGMYTQLLV